MAELSDLCGSPVKLRRSADDAFDNRRLAYVPRVAANHYELHIFSINVLESRSATGLDSARLHPLRRLQWRACDWRAGGEHLRNPRARRAQ